jgi:hypothetical protein
LRQADVVVHLQRREARVDPIDKGNEVGKHQERQQPPCGFSDYLHLDSALCNVSNGMIVPFGARPSHQATIDLEATISLT